MGPAPPPTSSAPRSGGRGNGCLAAAGRRRRHRDEAAEGKEGDATQDPFLKYSDATLTTYIYRQMKHLKHASETLTKTPKNT
jgi:hypothetical protein